MTETKQSWKVGDKVMWTLHGIQVRVVAAEDDWVWVKCIGDKSGRLVHCTGLVSIPPKATPPTIGIVHAWIEPSGVLEASARGGLVVAP